MLCVPVPFLRNLITWVCGADDLACSQQIPIIECPGRAHAKALMAIDPLCFKLRALGGALASVPILWIHLGGVVCMSRAGTNAGSTVLAGGEISESTVRLELGIAQEDARNEAVTKLWMQCDSRASVHAQAGFDAAELFLNRSLTDLEPVLPEQVGPREPHSVTKKVADGNGSAPWSIEKAVE